jgi:peptide/nickel transport system ATP-binding protein
MSEPVLEARDVRCTYQVSAGFMRPKTPLHAVNGIDLHVRRGEAYALVGESGCGKTTLAKMLMGLQPPSSGEIQLAGEPIRRFDRTTVARFLQPVFQDPYASLNPRKSVGTIVMLPLKVQGDPNPETWRKRTEQTMDLVGLPRRVFNSYPSQLSGGQRQRVAIARAIINRPQVLICDEPTSALDVSVQAQILNLLQDLRKEFDLTYILISHDLAVVEHMTERVGVMYLGRIVEESETDALFRSPRHPYTYALMQSVLTPDPELGVPDAHLGASYPDPVNPPSGCPFHPRCPKAMNHCSQIPPRPLETREGRVECHLYDEANNYGRAAE